MEKQILVKPASVKQLAYIKRLSRDMGLREVQVSEKMSSSDASRIISELIAKAGKNGAANGKIKVNEPRLGMAMKECFRLWTRLGRDVWGQGRAAFILEAISTYELFTQIAEQVERGTRGAVEHGGERATKAASAA